MSEDVLLVEYLNAGSRRAFSAIYDKYVGMVRSYALKMLGDDSLADDVVQFVFLKLWEKRESIDSVKNLPAWLYVVAKNCVYKELSSRHFSEDRGVAAEAWDAGCEACCLIHSVPSHSHKRIYYPDPRPVRENGFIRRRP